jgi:DNA helicase-2/ATP-dependent DNA helicase PcrA
VLAEIDYLHRLNPEQRRAVEHGVGTPGEIGGPLLVIAGAGSGKTNTLAHRVAHLIVNGADPRRILLMTFSRRAAGEMTRRVERIAAQVMGLSSGAVTDALAWAGTFHGIGARLLREYAPNLGLDQQFTIHDREDSADLLNIVRHDLGFHDAKSRFPAKGTCLAIYSRTVNAQGELADTLKFAFPWAAMWEPQLRDLFSRYVTVKQEQNVLDYDDLLLYWAMMMRDAAIAADLASRFDHVLVDEYQDTNRLQSSILLALKPDGRGMTVVGDDAQSIYSFRAATVRNILEFPSSFAPAADIVTLDRNYRSTVPILDAANAMIAEAEERFTKNLWTERKSDAKPQLVTVRDEPDQARYVVERVLESREGGARLMDQAVLFRSSSHSGPLEIELTRRNIPFVKYGGLKFLDAAHVKDMLALLRWAENPRDRVAGFRVLQLLPGVGPGTAGKVLDVMDETPRPFITLGDMPAPARSEGWDGFLEVVGDLAASREWPASFTRARSWYEPILEEAHEDAAVRLLDLLQLEQIASGYPSRERFLTELTLDPPDATSDLSGAGPKDEDYLILSTIHSAKGQEWRSVHVLNVVDGCIPSDLGTGSTHELEEERRLLYVAMTRARDQLHLIMPQRFFVTQQQKHGDRHMYAQRTRFITRAMLPLYDDVLWPALKPVSENAIASSARLDLKATMRGMWAK